MAVGWAAVALVVHGFLYAGGTYAVGVTMFAVGWSSPPEGPPWDHVVRVVGMLLLWAGSALFIAKIGQQRSLIPTTLGATLAAALLVSPDSPPISYLGLIPGPILHIILTSTVPVLLAWLTSFRWRWLWIVIGIALVAGVALQFLLPDRRSWLTSWLF